MKDTILTIPHGFEWDSCIPLADIHISNQNEIFRRVGSTVEITINYPKCLHEFVDVGFSHSKMVCKHCDMEK